MPGARQVQHTTMAGPTGRGNVAAITLDGVVSTIGPFPVLAGVDLRVARGEVVLVSGPNGAGKSSLLRLLAGLLPVTSGHAAVLGHDLRNDSRAHRTRVALVAQETFCYDDLSVLRNLHLHAMAAGTGKAAAEAALHTMRLDDVAHAPTVAFPPANAVAARLPSDWPVERSSSSWTSLMPGSIRRPDAWSTKWWVAPVNKVGTVLVVSHELERVRPIADREIVVAGGCVVTQL